MEGTLPVVASETSEKILEIARRIAERFHPDRIILFGSQARGAAGPTSDVDLLVVMPVTGSKRDLVVDIRMAIESIRMAKDVIVATPEEFEGYGNVVGTIAYAAHREGRVLYRRPGVSEERPPWDEHRWLVRSLRSWVRKAEEDLAAAEHLLGMGDACPFAIVGFHAQQCAEKYIKAKLVRHAIEFPRAHDIEELLELLPADVRPTLAKSLQERRLTSYAVEARYPDETPVDRAAAEEAVVIARQVRQKVREGLPTEALAGLGTIVAEPRA